MADHSYEVIVQSTPENVWKALTDSDLTEQYYFGSRYETDWKAGSTYRAVDHEGNVSGEGEILAAEENSVLKTTFKPLWLEGGEPSTLTWELTPLSDLTLIKLTQSNIDDETFEAAQMHIGWVYILSSLKSLLETGKALPVPEIFASS